MPKYQRKRVNQMNHLTVVVVVVFAPPYSRSRYSRHRRKRLGLQKDAQA